MFDAWQEQLRAARVAGHPPPLMPRDVAAKIVASIPKSKAARGAFTRVARVALNRGRLTQEAGEIYRAAITGFEEVE